MQVGPSIDEDQVGVKLVYQIAAPERIVEDSRLGVILGDIFRPGLRVGKGANYACRAVHLAARRGPNKDSATQNEEAEQAGVAARRLCLRDFRDQALPRAGSSEQRGHFE